MRVRQEVPLLELCDAGCGRQEQVSRRARQISGVTPAARGRARAWEVFLLKLVPLLVIHDPRLILPGNTG